VSAERVAVTGATGYLGSLFASAFQNDGHNVVALTRSKPTDQTMTWRRFELGETPDAALFEGVDVLVHSAWDLGNSSASDAWQRNVVGSRRLINAAHVAGVKKVIFISSMSAYTGTTQTYGLMKLAVERTALDLHDVVVRPGLVYGDDAGGMAGTLRKIAGLPVWPRFGHAKLFLAHADDVASALVRITDDYDRFASHVIGLANPERVDLSTILTSVSSDGRTKTSLPVPSTLVMTGLRVVEKARVPLPFRSDSLLGLIKATDVLPGQDVLSAAGITFRGLPR